MRRNGHVDILTYRNGTFRFDLVRSSLAFVHFTEQGDVPIRTVRDMQSTGTATVSKSSESTPRQKRTATRIKYPCSTEIDWLRRGVCDEKQAQSGKQN